MFSSTYDAAHKSTIDGQLSKASRRNSLFEKSRSAICTRSQKNRACEGLVQGRIRTTLARQAKLIRHVDVAIFADGASFSERLDVLVAFIEFPGSAAKVSN